MQRTPINPWPWSTKVGYNQAELLEGASRHLICAGQTAVDDHGRPMHPNDMRSQVALSMDNLEAVLQEAGMGLENVSGLRIYATDVESAMKAIQGRGGKCTVIDPRYTETAAVADSCNGEINSSNPRLYTVPPDHARAAPRIVRLPIRC